MYNVILLFKTGQLELWFHREYQGHDSRKGKLMFLCLTRRSLSTISKEARAELSKLDPQ